MGRSARSTIRWIDQTVADLLDHRAELMAEMKEDLGLLDNPNPKNAPLMLTKEEYPVVEKTKPKQRPKNKPVSMPEPMGESPSKAENTSDRDRVLAEGRKSGVFE